MNCVKSFKNAYPLNVDRNGFINFDDLKEWLDARNINPFVIIDYANSEIGTIQDGQSSSTAHTEALNALKRGNWVIACMGKGNWTSSGHFILLYGYENGYVYINDPASMSTSRIKNTWDLFAKQVKYLWIVDVPDNFKGSTTVSSSSPITSNNTGYSKNQFIKDIQVAIGAKVDGIAGTETLSKTITISKSKNSKHAAVKPIQKYLNMQGYYCGTTDGVAGVKFDSAVKVYQKTQGCVVDGEITARKNTWKSLLGLK